MHPVSEIFERNPETLVKEKIYVKRTYLESTLGRRFKTPFYVFQRGFQHLQSFLCFGSFHIKALTVSRD